MVGLDLTKLTLNTTSLLRQPFKNYNLEKQVFIFFTFWKQEVRAQCHHMLTMSADGVSPDAPFPWLTQGCFLTRSLK